MAGVSVGAGAGVAVLKEAVGVGSPEVAAGDGCMGVGAGPAAEEHATAVSAVRMMAMVKLIRFGFMGLFHNSCILLDAIVLKKIRGLYT
jgi:hypothetical protein